MTQELLFQFKSALGTMSYYNAAEGSWRDETEDRNACRAHLKVLSKNLTLAGIDVKAVVESTACLVSSSDYTPDREVFFVDHNEGRQI